MNKVKTSPISPTITLRKGNVEIDVKNAAAVIRRINEMYPNTSECSWPGASSPKSERVAQHEKQKQWVESAKNWFKQTMFGGIGDFEVVVNEANSDTNGEINENNTMSNYAEAQRIIEQVNNGEYEKELERSQTEVIKTTNKNAYEIRLEVLQEATKWLSLENVAPSSTPELRNGDAVISLAQKFYRFVENRR